MGQDPKQKSAQPAPSKPSTPPAGKPAQPHPSTAPTPKFTDPKKK